MLAPGNSNTGRCCRSCFSVHVDRQHMSESPCQLVPKSLRHQGMQAPGGLLNLQKDRGCILLAALLFIRAACSMSLLELAPAPPCLEGACCPFVLLIHHQLALAVVHQLAAAKALLHVCWSRPHLCSHATLYTDPAGVPYVAGYKITSKLASSRTATC